MASLKELKGRKVVVALLLAGNAEIGPEHLELPGIA